MSVQCHPSQAGVWGVLINHAPRRFCAGGMFDYLERFTGHPRLGKRHYAYAPTVVGVYS